MFTTTKRSLSNGAVEIEQPDLTVVFKEPRVLAYPEENIAKSALLLQSFQFFDIGLDPLFEFWIGFHFFSDGFGTFSKRHFFFQ